MKVGVLSSKENVEHPHSQWGYQKRNPGDVRKLGVLPLSLREGVQRFLWGVGVIRREGHVSNESGGIIL